MDLYNSCLNNFFRTPRPIKRLISVLADLFFVGLAFWGALLVRLDTSAVFSNQKYWFLLFFLIITSLAINVKLGLYRAVIRYISSKALVSIGLAVLLSTLSLILLSFN